MKKTVWPKGPNTGGDCGLFQEDGYYTKRFRFKGRKNTFKSKSNTVSSLCLNTSPQSQDRKSHCQSQNYKEENVKYLQELFQRVNSLADNLKAGTVEPCVTREGKASSEKGSGSFPFKRYLSHFKYVAKLHEPPSLVDLPMEEHQFKLIEKEFRHQISDRCPNVKVHKAGSSVVFDGPNDEVKIGVTILDELVKQVKKRMVNLSTALLTFIKSSSAISRYSFLFEQTLKHSVSVEVGAQLALSSLSLDAMDEAEAILRTDISLITVRLLDIAAPVLHRVKETMTKATNQENSQELRVNTNFIPSPKRDSVTKMRLVGYTESVNKLKAILNKSLMSQGDAQEVLNLPGDLVRCFDTFLKMIRPRQTEVTLQASTAPIPHIVLTGPPQMVQGALKNTQAALATLTSDTLLFDGPGAHWYFKTEGTVNIGFVQRSCQVIIEDTLNFSGVTRSHGISTTSISEGQQGTESNKLKMKVKLGQLEDEQADILVAPMVKSKIESTNVGKSLLRRAGNSLKFLFEEVAASSTLKPGDILQVDAPAALGCSKLFFIECLPWDGVGGQSVQALEKGLLTCLDLCEEQCFHTVALPVMGPGPLLKFNLADAIQLLTGKICQFASSASLKFLSDIHIVIKPDNPNSEECYNKVCECLRAAMENQSQSIFKSLTTDLDRIVMTVGGKVKLHLVFGDITNEATEAVVNTTDFQYFNSDVCKDILAIAGPEVESELRARSDYVARGEVYQSQSGSYPCSVLLHVCGENDAASIQKLVVDIIDRCEKLEVTSVAIPALRTGAGGMDGAVVAQAILLGVKAATSFTSLKFVREVRLVLFKIDVFLAFKQEAMQMFPSALNNKGVRTFTTITLLPLIQDHSTDCYLVTTPAGPVPELHHAQQQPHSSVSEEIKQLAATSTSQKSSFLILGCSRNDVDEAMTKLNNFYEAQCSTLTFKMEELANLSLDDMRELKLLMESQHLCIKEKQDSQGTAVMVTGLKDGVNRLCCLVNTSVNRELKRELRVREENDLHTRVTWCILPHSGNWQRVPKRANYYLEKKEVVQGIVDAQGMTWNVDLQSMEAILRISGQRAKLKRLVNLSDLMLPLCWDNMTTGGNLEMFVLQPLCPEYQTVEKAFSQSARKTVLKIERVQNVHLRRAYEVQKKRIADKNRLEGSAGEKLLYHGTTNSNSKLIVKNGFNRRFSGKNATCFGHGTYFAVDASYSANRSYSKPAADGTQLMFVARVLTGSYTLGNKDMRVPPLSPQTQDSFDSVVDELSNPSMYVVFHDNQAYPEYLITFK